jgi:hypothetical protein
MIDHWSSQYGIRVIRIIRGFLFLPLLVFIRVHLLAKTFGVRGCLRKNRKNFPCSRAGKSTKSSSNVQSAKPVIVNTQEPNAPIEIGFAAP